MKNVREILKNKDGTVIFYKLFERVNICKQKVQLGGHMNKSVLITIIAFMLLPCANLEAQGIYLGAGIGNTFYSSEIQDAVNQVQDISENSTAWKIFGGYHFTSFLSAEGGYRSFGKINSNIGSDSFSSTTTGWDVEAVGRLQILIIDIFGKAGVMFWSTDVTFLGQTSDESGTDFFWGLGLGAHIGPFGARVEWESVAISGPDNLSMVSLSATFGF
jgi:OOP family OmpA-OmpF porin